MTATVDVKPSPRRDAFALGPWAWTALAAIVLLAAALRWHGLGATSVWCDELLSLHLSAGRDFEIDRLPRGTAIARPPDLLAPVGAPWRVWTSLAGDVHPPLYYLLLRGWRALAGDAPVAIRSLSALCGTLAVLAAFALGREVLGTAGALWVALLNALAGDGVYFGQEARMYAPGLLLTTLAMAQLLNAERRGFGRARCVSLGVWCLLSMLTLYLAAAPMLATGFYAIARLRGRDRRAALATLSCAALAYAAVWLPFMSGQAWHTPRADWLRAEPAGHALATLVRVAALPLNHFGPVLQRSAAAGYAFAAFYLLPLCAVRRRPAAWLPWMAVACIVAVPAAQDLARTTNMLEWPRYTVLMLPPLTVAIVASVWEQSRRVRHLVPAALCVFCLVSLPATYATPRYDFRGNAEVAERAVAQTGGRAVFASTWNPRFSGVLLLSAQYHWHVPPRDVLLVESVGDLERLPRAVVGDRVVLIAGDAPADLAAIPGFEEDGPRTYALGVGSVTSLTRRAPPASTGPAGGGTTR